jgi:hypothetical protein
MTVIIIGVLTKNVANTTNSATSADAAQSAMLTLESYVNGAVSPTSGAVAELQPSQVTNICWGSNAVSPEEVAPYGDGWTMSNATQLNETIGIVYAHDFAMEFCGYGSDAAGTQGATSPNVYEIYVQTHNPDGTSSCTANYYCPLKIVNLTPFSTATGTQTAYSTGDYPTADIPPAAPPVTTPVVNVIGRVWCDKACQQLGIACSSMATATAEGLTSLPSNYATLCPAGYLGTPPLFNYYTSAGIGGNPASTNPSLNWTNAYTNASTNPPNVVTSTSVTSACVTNATTFVVASCGPMDVYSPVDAQTLQNVQCVILNMTVLGQNNPANTSSKSSSVNITDQVWLRGLAG